MITVVGNLKGGAGKSTVAFNLSVWLATAGVSVTAYDLDPQCTLSDVMEVRREEGFEPLVKVYTRHQANHSDETLIDVGTANMQALKRAISMADRILVPVAPSQADIWSTQRFLYLIASTVKNKPPEILAFINRADTHTAIRESDQAEEALDILPGIHRLNTRLGQRTVFRRSFSEGLGVFELEPSGKAAHEFEALATQLYPEIMSLNG